MVLEHDRKLVEVQVKDSQDRMNNSDSTVVLNLLHKLFEFCRRWPWYWNVTGNWLRRK
jgi:hypothetical protein